jgi:hypothetical protein
LQYPWQIQLLTSMAPGCDELQPPLPHLERGADGGHRRRGGGDCRAGVSRVGLSVTDVSICNELAIIEWLQSTRSRHWIAKLLLRLDALSKARAPRASMKRRLRLFALLLAAAAAPLVDFFRMFHGLPSQDRPVRIECDPHARL